MTLQRYVVYSDTPGAGGVTAGYYETPDGEWVKWEDAQHLITALREAKAQSRRLDALEEKWRQMAKRREADGETFLAGLFSGFADELRGYREVEQG